MSTTDELTTPPDESGAPDGAPDSAATDDDDQDQGDDTEPAGKEAGRYRRQLRQAEAERDALSARLEHLQRTEADRLITERGIRPAAVWASGTTVADCPTESGDIDPAKVQRATDTAISTLGLSVGRPPSFEPGSRTAVTQAPGWSDLIRGRT